MTVTLVGKSVIAHERDTEPIRPSTAVRSRRTPVEVSPGRLVIGFPLMVWFIHFLIVQLSATVAQKYGTPTGSSEPANHPPILLSGVFHHLVDPLKLWDGLWYRMVALEGYENWSAKAAFWPLLPQSMGWISDTTGVEPEIIGYLIANLSFALGLILLYRLVALDFGEATTRRTLWAIALFPTSLFFSAVYTESLFLVLSVAALLAARVDKWWLAGIFGLLAALTRSYGVFLVFPFAVLWVKQHGLYVRELFPRGINLLMPVLGPIIFGWHLERTQGTWRAFIDVQSEWNRTFAWPWETMKCAVDGCVLSLTQYGTTKNWPVEGADWTWFDQLVSNPSWGLVTSEAWRKEFANSDTVELGCVVLFLVLAILGLKLLPLYMSVWMIPGLIVPLFSPSTVHPLMSMPRFGLTLFPLFVVIAVLLRTKWLAWPFAVISTALLVVFTMQFANWYWVS